MSRRHELRWEPAGKRLSAEIDGTTIARTEDGHVLHETGLPPVYYFPLADISTEFLERTEHATRCQFKGQASYWSIVVAGRRIENALWAYEAPIEDASYLKGFGAFYADRVKVQAAT